MVRTLVVVAIIFVYLFLVGPVGILYALLRGKPNILYHAGRLGCRIGLKLSGIKLQIKGLEQVDATKTYLFVANHQSNCDPPALFVTIPQKVRFLLKKELEKIPVLGRVMKLGGFVFVDRQDRVSAIQAMNQAVAQMQQGESFLVFPEGTRTRTGKMGSFKKGPFVMALQAGISIMPITIAGSYDRMPPAGFRITPGVITLIFHPAMETQALPFSSREILMEEVWRTIASELGEVRPGALRSRENQYGRTQSIS